MAELGRPNKIGAEHLQVLQEFVQVNPTATLAEIRAHLISHCGISAHEQTIVKALRQAGIMRLKGRPAVDRELPRDKPKRYGYNEGHRLQLPEQSYPSSLTDQEWALVHDLFEGHQGVPPELPRRLLLDACCYVVRTGCSWRQLPREFGRWQNVYRTFRRWSEQGKFEAMHDRLRQQWRQRQGKCEQPSAAVLDSQSTRISPQGGQSGFDAGKKVKGRKRHLIVDTLGLLLAVSVTAASVQDRDGAHPVVAAAMHKYPAIETVFVDSAYAGQCAQTISQLEGARVQVVRHPANKNVGRWSMEGQQDMFMTQPAKQGFVVLAKRWVVERTHAWNEKARRLIMHHDRLGSVSEAWVWLTEARLLMRRLTV